MLELVASGLTIVVIATMAWLFKANRRLHNQLDSYTMENRKLLTTSNDLLRANEEMAGYVVTDEVVDARIAVNPKLVKPHMIDSVIQLYPEKIPESSIKQVLKKDKRFCNEMVNKVLMEEGLAHSWERTGTKDYRLGDTRHEDSLVSMLCARCGTSHRYWKLGGHPSFSNYEGYFFNGKKLEVSKIPPCVVGNKIAGK